jgi:biopolymer transport protein ExbD
MSHRNKGEKKRKETRNQPEEDPEFQIAPMIDILLVLLVFFMSISSTEVLQSNREISLPVAKDGKQPGKIPGQVIVNVTWGTINNIGSIEVNDRKFPSPYDIVPVLKDSVVKNPQTRVLIRADRAVRYDYMREILKAAASAGIGNVTFSVVDKDAPPQPK